jgi:hypothetical protein
MTETQIIDGGQLYTAVGEVPHTRKDGTGTTLVRWQSHYPKCGEPFETKAPKEGTNLHLNRRITDRAPRRDGNESANDPKISYRSYRDA